MEEKNSIKISNMEQNISVISKKVWDIVKVAMFMIKKGLCKKKIFMDLNMMMKRGKIARKALKNLMFHHHHNNHQFSSTIRRDVGGPAPNLPKDAPREANHPTNKAKSQYYHHHPKNSGTQYFTPLPYFLEDVENSVNLEEVSRMVEMVLRNDEAGVALSAPSPIKPAGLGLRRSPAVRQLRITDSPFPIQMNQDEDTKYVDQAADDFIKRFYCQLNQQSYC